MLKRRHCWGISRGVSKYVDKLFGVVGSKKNSNLNTVKPLQVKNLGQLARAWPRLGRKHQVLNVASPRNPHMTMPAFECRDDHTQPGGGVWSSSFSPRPTSNP
jgi:hypothetical protein